jgi:RsiW-degrading membrane proteinase PrsW (M82 family)
VLYLVHWHWHKFDLSVDAVIKYFAYGFLLSTGIAMVWETLVSIVTNLIFTIMFILSVSFSRKEIQIESTNDLLIYLADDVHWLCILYFFANSFIIAALVEEMAKYFAFWTMDHPDFSEISSPPGTAAVLEKNRVSHGSAITVAMVAAATGFACCENLGYIFGGSIQFKDGKFPTSLYVICPPSAPNIATISACINRNSYACGSVATTRYDKITDVFLRD